MNGNWDYLVMCLNEFANDMEILCLDGDFSAPSTNIDLHNYTTFQTKICGGVMHFNAPHHPL